MATETGHTNNGTYKTENSLDIFDGYDLPVMDFLCLSYNDSLDQIPYEFGGFLELANALKILLKRLGVCQEILDELSPSNITQQVV